MGTQKTTRGEPRPHGIGWLNAPGRRGETWNPVVGCEKLSAGCKNCYAKALHDKRHRAHLAGKELAPQYAHKFEIVQCLPERLAKPLTWRDPRMVFVNSVSDLFHDDVPFEFIAAVFGVMAATPQHFYVILTKRPERAAEFFAWLEATSAFNFCGGDPQPAREAELHAGGKLSAEDGRRLMDGSAGPGRTWPPPNELLGVSAATQAMADARIPIVLDLKARGHIAWAGVSLEPLIEGVTLQDGEDGSWLMAHPLPTGDGFENAHDDPDARCLVCEGNATLDWVIVGGESGARVVARPFDLQWARDLRDECATADAPFFFKQAGSNSQAPYAIMLKAVRAESPGCGLRARHGARYPLLFNRHGAASAVIDGEQLGLKPDEYELVRPLLRMGRAGADPSEWAEDLRVQQFPAACAVATATPTGNAP